MFEAKIVEKIKTHILRSATFFFFKKNRILYEIRWKDTVGPNRPQMVIYRIRFACWIPKATNKHSEYKIFIDFSTTTMVVRTPLNVT